MTAEQPFDATRRPNTGNDRFSFSSPSAERASAAPEISPARQSDAHAGARAPSGDHERAHSDGGDFGAGVAGEQHTENAGDAANPARIKRRRGSRGGRRRRGRGPGGAPAGNGANEHDAQPFDANDEPAGFDDSAPPSSDAVLDAPRSLARPEREARSRPANVTDARENSARARDEGSSVLDAPRADNDGNAGAAGPRNRRGGRSRRGRGRRQNRGVEGGAPPERDGEPLSEADAGFDAPEAAQPRTAERPANRLFDERARRSPRPQHDRARETDVAIDADLDQPATAPQRDAAPARGEHKLKRRRRGSRGGRGRKNETMAPVEVEAIPGEEDDLPALPELPEEAEVLTPPSRERERGRERAPAPDRKRGARHKKRGRAAPRPVEDSDDEDVEVVQPAVRRKSLILVNAADQEEQRVAVVEDDLITDFQMTVKSQTSVVNDIYRGRVVNLEPAIGAAFVDFGQGRNGFLHTSDVISAYGDKDWSLDKLLTTSIDAEDWDDDAGPPPAAADLDDDEHEDGDEPAAKKQHKPRGEHPRRFRARPRLPITDLLKKGEMVVVQVTKDAIGDKGPTLTTYISIPGRYLVLMPSMSRTGVSRKIEDEKERRRLKKILQQLEVPPGMGVIVRTAGVGRSKADLKRDLDYLKGAWETFGKKLRSGHGPAPLYQESDVAIRTVRDLFTPETEAVIVDDPEVHDQIVAFTKKLMPENEERVKLHTGPRPLFHTYGVEPDFEKIFSRRIELPSGGSIVFDQAEALVAIDVNSGRTRTDGFDFEEIALKTNMEAAPEIARQIRLRDLGGIIVVDFIDMMRIANMRTVERVFKDALAGDRARSKVGRISQFGLLELTRQRLGPGMNKKVFHTCSRCRGTGRVRTIESRAAAILRRLGSAMTLKGFSTVEVRAHPEVVLYLKNQCSEHLRALEYRFEREVRLLDAPEQSEDSVLRYLRTDGREVRPGGRRKR